MITDTGKGTSTNLWNMEANEVSSIGPLLETALQRSPLLYVKQGYEYVVIVIFFNIATQEISSVLMLEIHYEKYMYVVHLFNVKRIQ